SGKEPKSYRHKLALWDAETRSETSLGPISTSRMLFSPDGSKLALSVSAHDQGGAILWDVRQNQKMRRLTTAAYRTHCFAFTPDGKGIYCGSPDRGQRDKGDTLRGFALDGSGWKPAKLEKGDVRPHELEISPDGGRLAAAWENRVRVWDTATGKVL